MTPENVQAGFRATGIYPLDRSKFPESRLDPRLLRRYNLWVASGKPSHLKHELATSFSTPEKLKPQDSLSQHDTHLIPSTSHLEFDTCTSSVNNDDDNPVPSCSNSNSNPQNVSWTPENLAKQLGPILFPPPEGKMWLPVWTLVDIPKQKVPEGRRFEEAILNRITPPETKETAAKRRKIDPHAKVITETDFVEAMRKLPVKGVKKAKKL